MKCRQLLEPREFEEMVNSYDVSLLHPEIAGRAYELIKDHNINDVAAKSVGIVPLFNWVRKQI